MTREEKSKQLIKNIEKEDKKEKNKSIIKFLIKFLIITIILVFSLFYYMRFIETKFLTVKEIKIEADIPNSFHGFKIAHISDIHYLMSTEKKDLQKVVNKINLLKPDILVLTGDLLDSSLDYEENDISELKEVLSKINVTMNKYYIKGNHDYNDDVDGILESIDFINLNNNSDLIYMSDNSNIKINGYGSSLKKDFNYQEVKDDLYTITLIHEPDNADKIKDSDLILAGHSHNLQINIPYISTLFTIEGCKKYYRNDYIVNDTKMYINGGIGTSKYRLRLFNPPSINFYRLTTKKS